MMWLRFVTMVVLFAQRLSFRISVHPFVPSSVHPFLGSFVRRPSVWPSIRGCHRPSFRPSVPPSILRPVWTSRDPPSLRQFVRPSFPSLHPPVPSFVRHSVHPSWTVPPSVRLSHGQPVYSSVHLFLCLSVGQSVHPSVCLSVYSFVCRLSICYSVCLYVRQSVPPSVCISHHQLVYPFAHMFLGLSVRPSVCSSVSLFLCLSVSLFLCPSVSPSILPSGWHDGATV